MARFSRFAIFELSLSNCLRIAFLFTFESSNCPKNLENSVRFSAILFLSTPFARAFMFSRLTLVFVSDCIKVFLFALFNPIRVMYLANSSRFALRFAFLIEFAIVFAFCLIAFIVFGALSYLCKKPLRFVGLRPIFSR